MKAPYLAVFAFLIAASSASALPTATSSLFSASGNCAVCHDSDGVALTDSTGASVSVSDDWSATMMGQSFLDPLMRAKMRTEIERTPHLQSVIENKCTRCHAPMAKVQAHEDGDDALSLEEALASPLSGDGISCTVCHQIQDEHLGEESSFSGEFEIGDAHEIYGPYSNIFPNPMINNTGYTPMYSQHIKESELCATCHTLFTPYVDDEGQVVGLFPEQVPYLEWLNSEYSSGDNAKSCPDCHMPAIDDPIVISSRPPGRLESHSPFWQHHFVGGNTLVPAMFAAAGSELGTDVPAAQFQKTIDRATESLRHAVRLSIASVEGTDPVRAAVQVENLAGHKFPAGFPSRRAWLHVIVHDADQNVVFESGATDAFGHIDRTDTDYEPHHNVITSASQVQIYESIMGDVNDRVTYTLLRGGKYLKDNRLPPHGFTTTHEQIANAAIIGAAAADPDFNHDGDIEGTGIDRVVYELPLPEHQGPFTISVEMRYQTLATPFAEDLLTGSGDEVETFRALYTQTGAGIVTIASAAAEVRPVPFDGWALY